MQVLARCLTALGLLVAASLCHAAPNSGMSKPAVADEEKIQQGFQTFRTGLMMSMKRIVAVRDENYDIVIPVIVRRDDFKEIRPMQVEFGGTITLEGSVPVDRYGIHLSSVFLKAAPAEYIEFTAAQAICIMVLGIAKEEAALPEHEPLMRKCACAVVGKSRCIKTHAYILARTGSTLSDEEVEEYIKSTYDIQNFVWP